MTPVPERLMDLWREPPGTRPDPVAAGPGTLPRLDAVRLA